MTVSMAVTKSASTCSPKNVPAIANVPTTTSTSWTSAAMAVAPMRKSWKRNVTQARMPIDPSTIRSSACWAISALMIGPMFASWRTSSIGPNLSSSAKRRSASLPVVGSPIAAPVVGDADGPGLPPGTTAPDAPGDAEGAADGAAEGAALGAADGAAEGPALAGADADTDEPGASVLTTADAAGDDDVSGEAELIDEAAGDPAALGAGLGENSARPICSVRIRT